MLNFADVSKRPDAAELARLAERAASLQFDEPINVQFTSGTTGAPKGATLSHHNILNNGFFVEVMRRVVDKMHMTDVTIAYGMTETSPVSFQSSINDELERRVSTVGRVHPHLEVKVVDRAGRIVPRRRPGELLTRGYSVMLGYWADAARSASAYPIPVTARKSVRASSCAPASRRPTRTSVTSAGAGSLATRFPRYVRFVSGFPMTVTGKVAKYRLRQQIAGALGLREGAARETAGQRAGPRSSR
jgi:acyl-CoA synthetase (AMP-forming)/AMP-acid ligase II